MPEVQSNEKPSSFMKETMQLLLKEVEKECQKPEIKNTIFTTICDPILDYVIQRLSPYYFLLIVIFIVLLIVISVMLAFIILNPNGNHSITIQ